MFSGPDAQLMQDAVIIAILALSVGMAVSYGALGLHRRKAAPPNDATKKSNLEERVQVLERIATDRSIDLADEIEALRTPKGAA